MESLLPADEDRDSVREEQEHSSIPDLRDSELERLDNQTLLFLAIERGLPTWTKDLIEAQASLDAQDDSGSTPLMLATIMGHTECVRLLIAHNANVEARIPRTLLR